MRIALQKNEPDAVVLGTDGPPAKNVLTASMENVRASTVVFLCRKAAQLGTNGSNSAAWFTIDSRSSVAPADLAKFRQAFFAKIGTDPGIAAKEMYEAVRMIVSALRTTGANRVLLRDCLAPGKKPHDAATWLPFDPARNSLQEFTIVKL